MNPTVLHGNFPDRPDQSLNFLLGKSFDFPFLSPRKGHHWPSQGPQGVLQNLKGPYDKRLSTPFMHRLMLILRPKVRERGRGTK